MKRLLAFFLCTVLLSGMTVCFADSGSWVCPNCEKEVTGNFCPYCGTPKPEEEEPPEEEDLSESAALTGTFSIRSGIRWGMKGYDVETREENLKKDDERDYYYDPESGDISFLYYYPDEVKVSIFPCYLTYVFSRDKLFLVMYWLEDNNTALEDLEAVAYLKNAMISKYGDGREATREDETRIQKVLDMAENYYYTDIVKDMTIWDLPDDTTAVLLESEYTIESKLLFFNYGTMLNKLPQNGSYNTNGL